MNDLTANFFTMVEKRDILVADLLSFGFQTQTKIQSLEAGDGTPSELKKYEKYKEKLAKLQEHNANLLRIIKRR